MPARHAAFTLLEICLTPLVGMVLVLLAVPSVVAVVARKAGGKPQVLSWNE